MAETKITQNEIKPGVWHEVGGAGEPAFINSWSNYNAHLGGPGYATAGFIIDAMGYVHLKGLVRNGTLNSTIFVLPAGYRPLERHIFPSQTGSGLPRVDVQPGGDVIMQGGSTDYLSLSGIVFLAEQ